MLDDITKSVKAILYDRVTSPLLGTFAVSWILCNFQLLMVMFSDLNVEVKFFWIFEKLYDSTYLTWGKMLIFPSIATMFYIFVFPKLESFVFTAYKKNQKRLIDIKQAIEGDVLLSLHDSRKLRSEHDRLIKEHEDLIKRYTDKEPLYQVEHDKLRQELVRIKEENKELQGTLSRQKQLYENVQEVPLFSRYTAPKNEALKKLITDRTYLLHFPGEEGTKTPRKISFWSDGTVSSAERFQEKTWGVQDGMLNVFDSKSLLYSQFILLPDNVILYSTGASECEKSHGQFLIPYRNDGIHSIE